MQKVFLVKLLIGKCNIEIIKHIHCVHLVCNFECWWMQTTFLWKKLLLSLTSDKYRIEAVWPCFTIKMVNLQNYFFPDAFSYLHWFPCVSVLFLYFLPCVCDVFLDKCHWRFLLSLVECKNVLFMDDRWHILPITSHSLHMTPVPPKNMVCWWKCV